MKIIVKIGTESVEASMQNIAAEVAARKAQGDDVIIVSSGAVGYGEKLRDEMNIPYTQRGMRGISETQLLAGEGQPLLMAAWLTAFRAFGIIPMQALLTSDMLADVHKRTPLRDVFMRCAASPNSVAIVNENDTIAVDELPNNISGRFTDNDEQARILACEYDADYLLLLTGTDGLYTADPNVDKNASHITRLYADEAKPALTGGSGKGRGGVESKIDNAFAAANKGITTVIARATRAGVINDSLGKLPSGTVIYPSRRMSGVFAA